MEGSPDDAAPAPAGPSHAAASAELRANIDFKVVLAGQAVSALGDAISLTAMPLLVLILTGSGALMGVVGALQLVPDLVLGLFAGAFADRWDRRRMMQLADLGRAVLTMLIPLAVWLDLPAMTVIIAVTVPVNVLRVLSDAAYSSSIPQLVGRENLGRANSYLEATLSVPFIVGPALAGVLVTTIGAGATIAIDAGSFAVSAVSLVFVRRTLRADRIGEIPRILDDIREGIAFVWRSAPIRLLVGYWGTMTLATAALLPALAYYITVDRDRSADLFGFLGSAWSVGYLAGSLVAGRLRGRRVGLRIALAGAVIGASVAAIAATPVVAVYLGAAFVVGAALAVQLVSYATTRQSLTPDVLLGRVGSSSRVMTAALRPLGMLAAGALMDATTGATALIAMGGAAVAASVVFGSARTFREVSASHPAR